MPVIKQKLTPKQKALTINLDHQIYGTFAEIGAGQETVRHFFRAGGASGTIAKAMSAYDKDYSDAIYGKEEKNRYVTQNRLKKMLDYEVGLMEERIDRNKKTGYKFFAYANTVTTIDYKKTNKGHGWVGIKFQAQPDEDYSIVILHIRFKENDSTLQQETLGKLGVNLIYGVFYYYENPRNLINSIYDHIALDKIEIDMIDFEGPAFEYVDNRLMSLHLINQRITDTVVFNSQGHNMLPSDILYKKHIFAVRGSFRPVTLVSIDMFENAMKMFMQDTDGTPENTIVLFEITLANLIADGNNIDERDFLDRVDILAKLGYTVMVSNFSEYYRLMEYFTAHKCKNVGIAMGVNNLLMVFDERYYTHLSGGILEALGRFFRKDMRVYLYPYKNRNTGEILNSNNLRVSDSLKELYKYFKHNRKILDIAKYRKEYTDIHSQDVLNKIICGEKDWENQLPEGVADLIKDRGLFGYKRSMAEGFMV